MTPEGRIKKECRKILREKGCYVYSSVPVGYGPSTIDDLVCWRGRFIGIEYKRPGVDKPTDRQKSIMGMIAAAGGITLLVNDPKQILDLFEMLETAKR